ncbi:hypothetical protein [Kibdelosporangium philippinense]|uniref:hypothetical protein n=1 Tax=Kibdelosporangium philippinense TaxID=211113 RepID=UPI00360A891C
MVRLREKLTRRWGKWPAGAIALVRVLAKSAPLHVTINKERHMVWMVFVGNGSYRPKGFAPTTRSELDKGLMDVRYIRADVRSHGSGSCSAPCLRVAPQQDLPAP